MAVIALNRCLAQKGLTQYWRKGVTFLIEFSDWSHGSRFVMRWWDLAMPRSREIIYASESRDLYISHRCQIWQASRQHCCRSACQISKRYGYLHNQFNEFKLLEILHKLYDDDIIKWKHLRVTGPLCGEFTCHRWISLTKASDAEHWCFLCSTPEQTVE